MGAVVCRVADSWGACCDAVGDPADEASVFVGFPAKGECEASYEGFGAWRVESAARSEPAEGSE